MGLLSELKRRNVLRMVVLYAVAAWLVMQVAGVLTDLGAAPKWIGPWVVVALAAGLPIAIVVAWFFELTPQGLVREDKSIDESPAYTLGSRRTDFVIIGMLSAALLLMLVWQPPRPTGEALTVLTFDSAAAADDSDFARGLSIELLNLVAQVLPVKVKQPPEPSVLEHYPDLPTLAKELGVRWVLKGNVRRAANRVRVAVQLVDANDQASIAWSNVYDREMTAASVFGIQTEIARIVAGALRQSLDSRGERRLETIPTENAEAYTAYLIGRSRMTDRKVAGLEDAVRQFARAVQLDPRFAGAYSGLVDACFLYERFGRDRKPDCPETAAGRIDMARNAVALDPELGEAWISLAEALSQSESQESSARKSVMDEADAAFQHGLELNPSQSQGYHWYALHLSRFARFDSVEAWWIAWQNDVWWKVVQRGLEVDPLSLPLHYLATYPMYVKTREQSMWHARRIVEIAPDSPRGYERLGEGSWGLYGRADEMVRWAAKAMALDPRHVWYPAHLALAYAALGDYDRALAWFGRARSVAGDESPLPAIITDGEILALWYGGRRDEAVARLESLQATATSAKVFHFPLRALAGLDLAAGQPDKALDRYRQYKPECFDPALAVREPTWSDWAGLCPVPGFARVLQASGQAERAATLIRLVIERMAKLDPYRPSLEYELGNIIEIRILAVAEQADEALSLLEKLVEQGFRGYEGSDWNWRFFAYDDITLDSIRDDPRFNAAIAVIETDMAQQLENVRTMELRGEIPTPGGPSRE